MKNIALCVILLVVLSHCIDENTENPSAKLLVGVWENADNTNTIAFDKNGTYTLTFNENTASRLHYRLEELENVPALVIYDTIMSLACEYHFLGNDELKLAPIIPHFSGTEKQVSSYFRIK